MSVAFDSMKLRAGIRIPEKGDEEGVKFVCGLIDLYTISTSKKLD
jgi:hypothetical protein